MLQAVASVLGLFQAVVQLWHAARANPTLQHTLTGLGWLELLLQGLAVLAVLARRREPSVTLAWLLGIVLLPVAGLLLFWFFGRGQVRRLARPRRKLLAERRAEEREAHLEAVPAELRALARTGWEMGRAPVTLGNRVQPLFDGTSAYAAMLEDIARASLRIDAAYYIFEADQTGRRFLDALVAAVGRGVRVRLLLDAFGTFGHRSFFAPLTRAGGEVRFFLPLNPLNGISLNFRNHRKILVVDDRVGFTGGINIGEAYRKGTPELGAWRDTHLRLEGPAAAELQGIFADDWAFVTHSKPEPRAVSEATAASVAAAGDCSVQIVPSGPDDRAEAIYSVFFAAISTARRTLDLCTPYFVPDQAIWVAIRSAAMRGVRVRLIVPLRSDFKITMAASRSYAEELMTAGVEIYRYTPGMIHAKTLIIDDSLASVGTANMDIRSFRLNFEVTALIYGTARVAPLVAAFQGDLARSQIVDPRQFGERPFLVRVIEGFARLLSPIL